MRHCWARVKYVINFQITFCFVGQLGLSRPATSYINVVCKRLNEMIRRIINSLLLGLVLCAGQSFGESIIGFFITSARRASDVNFEGAIMFMWIRIVMTLIPYLTTFVIVDLLTKEKMRPSLISFVINVIILIYFYNVGLIQKDPTSFIIGSLLTSLILLIIDKQSRTRKYLKINTAA